MQDSSEDLSSLDELFSSAAAHIRNEREATKRKKERRLIDHEAVSQKALYADPANWQRTRGIALIHAETETLLGNFSEYVHCSVADCRKLVREEGFIVVSAQERVSGSWWLPAERRPEPKQVWHVTREAILHVHLPDLQVHAPACSLRVFLSYGDIARIELAADTQFAGEDGTPQQMLYFPAGTNIMEVMSRDCKIALRAELAV